MRPFALFLAASLLALAPVPDTPIEGPLPLEMVELEHQVPALDLELELELELALAPLELGNEPRHSLPEDAPAPSLPVRISPRAWQPRTT
jgi:hypothetical protein